MLANTYCLYSGQTLTIKASGTVTEEVKEGAYALLEVKYGLITLIRQTVDLCEQIQNVDLKCPLKKGEMTLTKQVDLPSQIPPVSKRLLVFYGRGGGEQYELICTRANTMSTPMSTMPMIRKSLASRLTTSNSSSVVSNYLLSYIYEDSILTSKFPLMMSRFCPFREYSFFSL